MSPYTVGAIVFACVFGAALLALCLRRFLPEDQLRPDTKDTVKLAMGLVTTMTAMVLGLLVASAKGSYDIQKSEVIQMAGKAAFLDRVLAHYGSETAQARALLHEALQGAIAYIWSQDKSRVPQLGPNNVGAETLYDALEKLAPQSDAQRSLKSQAIAIALDIGQIRSLLFEQAGTSVAVPFLVIVVFWLAVLFFSFGLFGPANGTVIGALLVGALSVSAAILLILELDHPFGGMIQISSRPMLNTLNHLGN